MCMAKGDLGAAASVLDSYTFQALHSLLRAFSPIPPPTSVTHGWLHVCCALNVRPDRLQQLCYVLLPDHRYFFLSCSHPVVSVGHLSGVILMHSGQHHQLLPGSTSLSRLDQGQ